MAKNIIAFIHIVFFSLPISASENVLNAGLDYQISLPDDWVEIPRDELDIYQSNIQEKTGQNQTYDYGYQSDNTVNWFEYPYALVQIRRIGRVSEDKLKKYKKIESGFEKEIDKVESFAGDLLSNGEMGELLYEQDAHILWSTLSMDVNGVGKVKGLISVKLTEFGTVQFMGYSKDENFLHYEPTFRQMAYSIKPSPNDIYKPRLTDNAPAIFRADL